MHNNSLHITIREKCFQKSIKILICQVSVLVLNICLAFLILIYGKIYTSVHLNTHCLTEVVIDVKNFYGTRLTNVLLSVSLLRSIIVTIFTNESRNI